MSEDSELDTLNRALIEAGIRAHEKMMREPVGWVRAECIFTRGPDNALLIQQVKNITMGGL